MDFKRATKAQAKLRMAVDGPAGSGKTWTALQVAKYLGSKIALIDTERGSASKYADLFEFDVLELGTFAPRTYVEAIKAAAQAGYDVLVIDSLSHAWFGKDGALDQKDKAEARQKTPNGYTAWREVTPMHNELVDAILQAPMHVIATMRTKMEYVQEKDANGRTIVKKVGMAPVQRDGVEYEFDIVGDMSIDHVMTVSKTRCHLLDGYTQSKPGEDLANIIKAWLTDGSPAPAPHWSKVPDVFTAFGAEAKALGYDNATARQTLGIDKYSDYKGTYEQAVDELAEYRRQHPLSQLPEVNIGKGIPAMTK
jgi:hypothetical protein